ncbi:MAG TPA: PIN domain-containing protein, partial [Gemmataceae bacterium]|nr:PIN domain-containing protein [Gemmataceae bacterium]
MDALVAVYDSCVLYPAFLRDFLVRLAIHGQRTGLFRAKWTGRIHREWIRAVYRNRHPFLGDLHHTRRLMDQHVLGCRVRGYQRWERRLLLPDPNDRHVLAAALACVADMIVTFNTRDFPPEVLGPFGIVAASPDELVRALLDTGIVHTAATEHRA